MSLDLNIENVITTGISSGNRAPLRDFSLSNVFGPFGSQTTEAKLIVLSNAKIGCACGPCSRTITMRTTSGGEPATYPVVVYDVNMVAIGLANNKADYVAIWNASPANAAVGVLSGAANPFAFTLDVCSAIPNYVYGDPFVDALVTEDLEYILSEAGEYLN